MTEVASLLNALGDGALRVYIGFHFDNGEDNRSVEQIIQRFNTFAIGEINETYEKFVFNNRCQNEGESFENFHANIRSLMKTCNYRAQCVDSIPRDHILLGIRDKKT